MADNPYAKYAKPAEDKSTNPYASYAKGDGEQPKMQKIGAAGFGDALNSVLNDAGWINRNLAGAGTAISNLVEGGKQIAGNADPQAIEANKAIEKAAPLGSFLGNLALFAPTSMVPALNTVAGAGLVGAATSALQPTQGDESRLKNTVVGTALGAGGQAVGNKVGGYFADLLAGRKAQAAAEASKNSVLDSTLKAAQEAGYVVPPSTVNPSWINKRLESIGGKAAIGQEAAMRNQDVTNELARKAIGLPENAGISESAINGVRQVASGPYREVAALSNDAADALEMLKQARFDANAQWKYYGKSADPAARKSAEALTKEAQGWEKFLEQEAQAAGKPDLVEALKKARVEIAKTHTVDRALNTSTGNVAATDLGRMIDKGAPLTGELKTIARFADAFPQLAREGTRIPTPGVSKSEALAAALLGSIGGAPAAALPFVAGPARSLALSRPYQALMAKPQYEPGLGVRALGQLTPDRLGVIAKALALTAQ